MAGNYKHGGVHTRLYNIWKCMRQRCSNPKSSRYSVYGAKGIKVCEEWNDFKRFHDWSMNNGYDEKLTLDRINNDLGYCPQNCRWVTYRRQENNKTNNSFIRDYEKSFSAYYFFAVVAHVGTGPESGACAEWRWS